MGDRSDNPDPNDDADLLAISPQFSGAKRKDWRRAPLTGSESTEADDEEVTAAPMNPLKQFYRFEDDVKEDERLAELYGRTLDQQIARKVDQYMFTYSLGAMTTEDVVAAYPRLVQYARLETTAFVHLLRQYPHTVCEPWEWIYFFPMPNDKPRISDKERVPLREDKQGLAEKELAIFFDAIRFDHLNQLVVILGGGISQQQWIKMYNAAEELGMFYPRMRYSGFRNRLSRLKNFQERTERLPDGSLRMLSLEARGL